MNHHNQRQKPFRRKWSEIMEENRKNLTFKQCPITEKEIDLMNQFPHLIFVQFDFCDFQVAKLALNPKIMHIVIDGGSIPSTDMLANLSVKDLKMIGSESQKKE